MSYLNIIPVYNEIKLLPLHLRWCNANELPLYIVDNFSTDGSWEWINDNKDNLAGFHRVDTKNAFDLRIIQRSIMTVINKRKPTWFVYSGADLFYITSIKLCDFIENVQKKGYNAISFSVVNLNNTGEEYEKYDPLNTYFYCEVGPRVVMITMYSKGMELFGDKLNIKNRRVYDAPGAAFNFGFTKSAEERNETFLRRQRAWDNGMSWKQGKHYRRAYERNWIWTKEELKDIRESEFASYYNILQEQVKDG